MPESARYVGDHTVLKPLGERPQPRERSPQIMGHETDQLLARPLSGALALPSIGQGLTRLRQLLLNTGELSRQTAIVSTAVTLPDVRSPYAL
jgi:hypothetical protein